MHDHEVREVVAAYADSGGDQRVGTVGAATALLVPVRSLVDVAADWFSAHR